MRFFNVAGAVRPADHYAIDPLQRLAVDDLLELIRDKQYFVLHAPRQTGKTTALIALRDLLNSGKVGEYRCVHVNVETAQVARDDVARGVRAILSGLAMSARRLGDGHVDEVWPSPAHGRQQGRAPEVLERLVVRLLQPADPAAQAALRPLGRAAGALDAVRGLAAGSPQPLQILAGEPDLAGEALAVGCQPDAEPYVVRRHATMPPCGSSS